MKIRMRTLCGALALASALTLAACSQEAKNEKVLDIVVTDCTSGLDYLDQYPNLESVDMRGIRDYEQIMAYIAAHPDVKVVYDVTIGAQTFTNDVTELTLDAGGNSFDSMMENLKYLPNVTKISLPETRLTAQEIQTLRETYPDITLEYTVSLLGAVQAEDVTTLDLSHMTSADVEEAAQALSLLVNLTEVQLMDASGASQLTLTDVAKLQDAQPNALFQYSFDLFGQIVTTADETVEFNEVAIGNEGEERIRQALDILDNCTYFKLDDCGLDNEVMAGIREDYPDTKVVWRVHIPPFSMLTDETMLRLTFHLDNNNIHDLKYLNDVTYLDVGHNSPLTDLSFIQYMPKLECVIISGSNVVDVSVFKNCPNLIWLEMCFCYNIQEISCLTDHPTLKYLNISFSDVSDLTPLENVNLERLNCMGTNVNWEQRQAFIEKHPDCLSIWEGKQPYGYGWRYNDYGYTFFEYYANMRIVFRYDDTSYFGNHKE